MYPKPLEQLITICQDESLGTRNAASSHWALSPGATSYETFTGTYDPHNVRRAIGRTQRDICAALAASGWLVLMAEENFDQIAVSLTPHSNFKRDLAGGVGSLDLTGVVHSDRRVVIGQFTTTVASKTPRSMSPATVEHRRNEGVHCRQLERVN